MYRCADPGVGSATTDIAAHRQIDVAVGRFAELLEQADGAHDLAGLTVPALGNVPIDPSFLDCGRLPPRCSLDGGDLAIAERRYRNRAGAQWLAVHQHRAGAALRDPEADLGPGHAENIAQYPEQGRVPIDIDSVMD